MLCCCAAPGPGPVARRPHSFKVDRVDARPLSRAGPLRASPKDTTPVTAPAWARRRCPSFFPGKFHVRLDCTQQAIVYHSPILTKSPPFPLTFLINRHTVPCLPSLFFFSPCPPTSNPSPLLLRAHCCKQGSAATCNQAQTRFGSALCLALCPAAHGCCCCCYCCCCYLLACWLAGLPMVV